MIGLKERMDKEIKEAILEALKVCEGNKTRAARYLEVSLSTLHYQMRRLGLKKGEGDDQSGERKQEA